MKSVRSCIVLLMHDFSVFSTCHSSNSNDTDKNATNLFFRPSKKPSNFISDVLQMEKKNHLLFRDTSITIAFRKQLEPL